MESVLKITKAITLPMEKFHSESCKGISRLALKRGKGNNWYSYQDGCFSYYNPLRTMGIPTTCTLN